MSLGLALKLANATLFKGVRAPTANQQFDALVAALSPLYAYNLADAATRWRNDAGTIPATTAGQTIGRLDDKSVNGHNASQATSASKPTLGNSGDLWWADGDGVDDWLQNAAFAVTQPWWRISAIRQLGWASPNRIFGPGLGAASGFLLQFSSSPNLALFDNVSASLGNAGAGIGSDVIAIERHDGGSSRLGIDAGTYNTGNPGTVAFNGVTLFSDGDGNVPGNARLYATMAGSGVLTDPQIDSVRTVMAALQGRSL